LANKDDKKQLLGKTPFAVWICKMCCIIVSVVGAAITTHDRDRDRLAAIEKAGVDVVVIVSYIQQYVDLFVSQYGNKMSYFSWVICYSYGTVANTIYIYIYFFFFLL